MRGWNSSIGRDLSELVRDAIQLSEEDTDPDVEEAWAVEAERRWREIESGKVQTIPWEEVKAKLLAKRK